MYDAIGKTHGPTAQVQKPNKEILTAFLVGPMKGRPMDRYVLLVTCEETLELVDDDKATLIFIAGFDPPSVFDDLSQKARSLCVSYPVSSHDELLKRIGSIDL